MAALLRSDGTCGGSLADVSCTLVILPLLHWLLTVAAPLQMDQAFSRAAGLTRKLGAWSVLSP